MSNRKLLFVTLSLLTTIVVVLVFLNIKTSKGVRRTWEPSTQPHTILLNSQFEEIWSSPVYVACNTCLSTKNQAAYFVGAQRQNGLYALIRLDISTGQVEWEQPLIAREVTSMWLDSDRIYIGFEGTQKIGSKKQVWGVSRVVAYEMGSGNLLWNSRIPGSNNILFLSATEDTVFVVGNMYLNLVKLEAKTGQQVISTDDRTLTLFELNNNRFVYQQEGSLISVFRMETGELIWQQKQPFRDFTYTDDALIVKTDNDVGLVKVIDALSGEILWEQGSVVSNIAASEGIAFLITIEDNSGFGGGDSVADAKLLAIDERTGELISTLNFEPSEIRSDNGYYTYNIATTRNIVVVYLGDSQQLFAFRFLPDE